MSLSTAQISNCSRAISNALSVIARPIPIPAAEWADQHFYMSPESSYVEGPWKTRPYQLVPLNLMGNDAVEELDIIKSARVGYTKMLMACAAYKAEHKKRNQIIYLPTDASAGEFMKNHVDQMIRDVRPVRAIASWFGKKHADNTRTGKTFDNRRQLWVLGGTSAKNYREKSVDDVYMDELDGFDENVDLEGRPDHLARKRNEGSYFPKMICGSTPTLEHRSLIYSRVKDAEVFLRCYVPCPHCGFAQHLEFDQIQCIEPKNPATAEYFCKGCGASFDYRASQRAQAECFYKDPDLGIWTPDGLTFYDEDDKQTRTPRHVALHIWSAYSQMTTFENIMRDFFKRKNNPVELQTWVNQTRGWVFKQKGQAPDWKRIYDRTRGTEFERNRIAPWVAMLTCGVDVQANRLELEVVGWGRRGRSQSIDYRVIMGDPSDLGATGPWEEMRAIVLREQWTHPSGVSIPISCTAVDSGFSTQTVYAFCREFAQPQVIPIKGREGQQTLVGIPRAVDVTERGRKLRRGVMLWSIGVSLAKVELYARLRQERPTEESGDPLPSGWCDFPEYGEDYFKMLTAEELVTSKNRRGFSTHHWEKVRERNEALDCRIYARAAASIKGVDRWTDEDWAALEDGLGISTTRGGKTEKQHGIEFKRSDYWK